MNELVSLLQQLVAIDSCNPPGREEEICRFIQVWLERNGIASNRVEFAPGRPSLLAEIRGERSETILLSGHLDTVAIASGWVSPPLQPEIHNDRLYGLGSTDMKGGLALLLEVFRQAALRPKPHYSLRLLLSADEEDQYRGAAEFARKGLTENVIFALVAEATAGKVGIGERGEFWLRVFFHGREAHGSTPEQGANAILACSRFLCSMEEEFQRALPPQKLGSSSWNVGKIEGGRQINIVAEQCWADLDIRLELEETKEKVIQLLESIGRSTSDQARFRWETISYQRPMRSDPKDPMIQQFIASIRKVTGNEPGLDLVTYCTDLPSLFPAKAPPFVLYGPGDIRQAHQPNEYLDLKSIEECRKVLENFLLS
jgi:succinyl-diaminopimelate desuccinylase